MDAQYLWEAFERLGVRFVNYFGIGQVLELEANCAYYLDCPGVAAEPSIKNDFVNGLEKAAYDPENLHITLSMTFIDLAHAERAAEMIALYDDEFPGMFTWSGELNVMKQALLGNRAEPATLASINEWAEFMSIFREGYSGHTARRSGKLRRTNQVSPPNGSRARQLPGQQDCLSAYGPVHGTDDNGCAGARALDESASGSVPKLVPGYFLGRDLQRLPPLGRRLYTVFQRVLDSHTARVGFRSSGDKDLGGVRTRVGGHEPGLELSG